MDSVTQTIVNYIEQTDVTNREDLLSVARIAFLDYLASLAPAETEQAVQDLARFIGTNGENVSKADKALYYGFASHYLDFDDAQANLAGHFSTVLYSALLAVLERMIHGMISFGPISSVPSLRGLLVPSSILPIEPKDGILRGPLVSLGQRPL